MFIVNGYQLFLIDYRHEDCCMIDRDCILLSMLSLECIRSETVLHCIIQA
jgi:hypothetical protein